MGAPSYQDLLKRAKEALPETISRHERFQIPEADIVAEGKTTIFRNFEDVCQTINRDPNQVFAFLLRELGTAGAMEGRRVVFKSRVTLSRSPTGSGATSRPTSSARSAVVPTPGS